MRRSGANRVAMPWLIQLSQKNYVKNIFFEPVN